MRATRWWLAIVSGLLVLGIAAHVFAYPDFARETKVACEACHTNPAGGPDLSDAGKAFAAEKKVPSGPTEGATYVGNKKCRMCHLKQFKAWEETPHANALALLSGDEEKIKAMAATLEVELSGPASKSDDCITCHVTGHKLPGGYPAADEESSAPVSNVTCEACHGPGSKHVVAKKEQKKATINGAVSQKMCTTCHTEKTSPKFDFDDYKMRGVHKVAASK